MRSFHRIASLILIVGTVLFVGCNSKQASPVAPPEQVAQAKGIATSPGVQTDGIATSPGASVELAPMAALPIGYAYDVQWGKYGSGPGQFFWPNGIAADKNNGTVYVVEKRNNRVQQFNGGGAFIRQWGSLGSATGQFSDPNGIALDGLGHVFVTDSLNQRVQMFDLNGNYLTSWGSHGSGNGQFSYPYGIVANSNGFVYVVDNVNSRVEKFQVQSSLGLYIVTYVTQWPIPKNSNESGPAPIAMSGNNLFVAVNDHIWKFDNAGNLLYQWGTQGYYPPQFQNIMGLLVDPSGELLVADQSQGKVQQWTLEGTYLSSFGTPGSGNGQFQGPTGMAVDSTGSLFVCDRDNERIQRFAPVIPTSTPTFTPTETFTPTVTDTSTETFTMTATPTNTALTTYSLTKQWGSAGTGPGQFNWPVAVAINKSVNWTYVVDSKNNRVQVFDVAGNYIRGWGSLGSGTGQFNSPSGIAVDGQGKVYVADTLNHRFQIFDQWGNFLAQYQNWGSGTGQINAISGIAVDGNNNIYITNGIPKRVQKYQLVSFFGITIVQYATEWPVLWDQNPDGPTQITWSGSGLYVSVGPHTIEYDANGNDLREWGLSGNTPPNFEIVTGLAVDTHGHLLEADYGQAAIQQWTLDGFYLNVLKNGPFWSPVGIAVDSLGNLIVCDRNSNQIEMFAPSN